MSGEEGENEPKELDANASEKKDPAPAASGDNAAEDRLEPQASRKSAVEPGGAAPDRKSSKDNKKAGPAATTPGDDPFAVQKLLDTPRTVEACRRLGFTLKDVEAKSFHDFFVAGEKASVEKQKLRFNHYETRRQEKLGLILSERARVIGERMQGGDDVEKAQLQGNHQFLQMMEGLLDKEAGRLERGLKQQLRYHNNVEKENGEQLEKERSLDSKAQERERKRQQALGKIDQDTKQLKTNNMQRAENSGALIEKNKHRAEAKQANYIASMLEQEVKLREFQRQKEGANFEKSERWRARIGTMKERVETLDLEREVKGQAQVAQFASKLEAMSMRREADAKAKQVRCEEQHLRVVDAMEKKKRVGRQHDYRRGKVAEQIAESGERIETLLSLKDAIVEQRRTRAAQQQALRGSRAISLKAISAGPGQYEAHRDRCLHEEPIAKIGTGKADCQFIEEYVKAVKGNPPPGAYEPKNLPDGSLIAACTGKTATMGKGLKKSFIDQEIFFVRGKPGPGAYENHHSTLNLSVGTKMAKEYIPNDKPPSFVQPNLVSPGPATYSVDPFHRRQDLQIRQKSLPSLGKAMKLAN